VNGTGDRRRQIFVCFFLTDFGRGKALNQRGFRGLLSQNIAIICDNKKEARRRLDALVAECRTAVRDKLVPALRNDFASVLGKTGWSVDLDTSDPQTVIFTYPSSEVSGLMPYVRPAIRLEMGAHWSNSTCSSA